MADVRFSLHSLKIHPESASSVIVRDLLSAQLQLAPEVVAEVTAAQTTPDHVAMRGQQQRLTFDTYDVPGVLDAIGVTGLAITSGTNPGVVLYAQKFDQTGGATSGSVARSYTIGLGCLYPRTLACDHKSDLRLTSELAIRRGGRVVFAGRVREVALQAHDQLSSRAVATRCGLKLELQAVVGGRDDGERAQVLQFGGGILPGCGRWQGVEVHASCRLLDRHRQAVPRAERGAVGKRRAKEVFRNGQRAGCCIHHLALR